MTQDTVEQVLTRKHPKKHIKQKEQQVLNSAAFLAS